MSMTTGEAMQALLAGKTVYCNKGKYFRKFKLMDDGKYLGWYSSDGEWESVPWLLNSIEGVYEEYSLTFKDALKAMLDGKVVESEHSNRKYILASACGTTFAEVTEDGCTRILITEIKVPEQIGKWKVVE